jgi:hypothetical protein
MQTPRRCQYAARSSTSCRVSWQVESSTTWISKRSRGQSNRQAQSIIVWQQDFSLNIGSWTTTSGNTSAFALESAAGKLHFKTKQLFSKIKSSNNFLPLIAASASATCQLYDIGDRWRRKRK